MEIVKPEKLRKHIELMNLHDKEYVSSVILEQYKRLIFYDFTGISLSSEKQRILMKIFNQYENYYGWKFYKYAFRFMQFNNDKITIQFNKRKEYFFTCYLFVMTIYFAITGTFIMVYYSNITELILSIVFYLISLTGLYYSVKQWNNLTYLKKLKKQLENH